MSQRSSSGNHSRQQRQRTKSTGSGSGTASSANGASGGTSGLAKSTGKSGAGKSTNTTISGTKSTTPSAASLLAKPSSPQRLRTTSLTLPQQQPLITLPRGTNRQKPIKKNGSGRTNWGSIEDEIRFIKNNKTGAVAAAFDDGADEDYDDDGREEEDDEDEDYDDEPDPLTREQVTAQLTPVLQEYLQHGDAKEVVTVCQSLSLGDNAQRLAEIVLELGLENNDDARELCSKLLCQLEINEILEREEICDGLDAMLTRLADLILDIPEACELLGKFMARAITDDCIPPKYLQRHDPPADELSAKTLAKAKALLTMPNSVARLEMVWGRACEHKPVEDIRKRINDLLQEYIVSGDKNEAERCLKELGVPHFHHEVVYEAILLALQEGQNPKFQTAILSLLTSFYSIGAVSEDQMNTGFRRIFMEVEDLALDIPRVYVYLDQFTHRGAHYRFVTPELLAELPSRPAVVLNNRRRYVSEGDRNLLLDKKEVQAKAANP